MKEMTVKEAISVIVENRDMEAIREITENHPLFSLAVAKGDMLRFADVLGYDLLLGQLANASESGTEKPKAKKKKSAESDGKELEDMTTKELIALCEEQGISVPHAGRNKQFYIDKLQKAVKNESEEDQADTSDAWEDEQQEDPYEGKTAKELHTMCKERGIKADIRKSAKFYAELLRKADEEAAENDDWDEDVEETPKNKRKNEKKAAKDADTVEEDDWDI